MTQLIKPLSDHQLLDRFRIDHDRAALDLLVRRYIDLVYSAALRQVRDAHLAEDITQAVFIVLVRNARTIRRDVALAAWLFTVTRHAVSNALRVRNRQRFHEMHKMLQAPESICRDDALSDEIRANLDDAIASLPSIERSSVLLHFFSNRSHKEVGQTLGLSEEAARKRIRRGLEKMRAMLAGRGVNIGSASILSGAMCVQPAPAGLVGSTVNLAMLTSSIAPTSTATAIAQGVIKMIALSKIKVAAALAAALLLAGGAASPIVAHMLRPANTNRPAQFTLVQTTTPATKPADQSKFAIDVDDQTHVEFLGVSTFPPEADTWHSLSGEAIDCPDERLLSPRIRTNPAPDFMIAAKVTKPESTVLRMHVPGSTTSAVIQMSEDKETILAVAFDGANSAKLELGISAGKWTDAASNDKPRDELSSDVPDLGTVVIHAIAEEDGKTHVSVSHADSDVPTQIVVVDDHGAEHKPDNINVRTDGQNADVTCIFDLPADQVKKVVFQSRPFTKFVDVSDISLDPDKKSEPKISVRDAKDGK